MEAQCFILTSSPFGLAFLTLQLPNHERAEHLFTALKRSICQPRSPRLLKNAKSGEDTQILIQCPR